MSNPYRPTGNLKSPTDRKKSKSLDNLFRNSKQMPALTILGMVIPLLIIVAALAGLAYAYLRSKLLKQIDSNEFVPDPADMEKVIQLRSYSLRYYAPAAILATYILLMIILIMAMS